MQERKTRKIQKPSNWEEVYKNYLHGVLNWKEASQKLGLKKSTFFNMVLEAQNDEFINF